MGKFFEGYAREFSRARFLGAAICTAVSIVLVAIVASVESGWLWTAVLVVASATAFGFLVLDGIGAIVVAFRRQRTKFRPVPVLFATLGAWALVAASFVLGDNIDQLAQLSWSRDWPQVVLQVSDAMAGNYEVSPVGQSTAAVLIGQAMTIFLGIVATIAGTFSLALVALAFEQRDSRARSQLTAPHVHVKPRATNWLGFVAIVAIAVLVRRRTSGK